MNARSLLVLLIVAATAAFVVGVSIERSDNHTDEATTEHTEAAEAEGHAEGESEEAEATHADEAAAGHDESNEEEAVLGIDVEATPFVILAAIGSLALALAVWLRPRAALLLVVVAVLMVAFAALDLRELFHQLDESETGLAVLAGVVAALHLAAALVAATMLRQPAPGATP